MARWSYEFAQQNCDALVARLPRDDASDLPLTIGTAFCDERHRPEPEGFLKDRATKLFGGLRNLARALEHMGCAGLSCRLSRGVQRST